MVILKLLRDYGEQLYLNAVHYSINVVLFCINTFLEIFHIVGLAILYLMEQCITQTFLQAGV